MTSCCAELKVDQVWVCEVCGLQIKIVKECNCLQEGADTCNHDACVMCCGRPLTLRG